MANPGVQKKQTAETPSVARGLWDPFWFMREMLGWGRAAAAPSFDVKETDDAYVCNGRFKLTLPDEADVAHVKAELDNGELTLVVPKAAAATPEPGPPPRKRRATGDGRGSAVRTPRRGAHPRSRRG